MLVIGIAGGSGSGKTTVVKELVSQLPENSVSVISQDAYYYDNGDKTPEEKKQINFRLFPCQYTLTSLVPVRRR